MKTKLLKYLRFRNTYHAIELNDKGGVITYQGLELKKKSKELHINDSFDHLEFDALKDQIPKNRPVALVINSNAVLTKRVESISNESMKIIHLAFPNIKIDDFYYQILQQRKFQFVSICRRTYITDVLETFSKAGIDIIDFSIGNLISSVVVDYVDTAELQTTNTVISMDDGRISNMSPLTIEKVNSYAINGLDVKSNQLLSFAMALHTILETESLISNFVSETRTLITAFNEKLFFQYFIRAGFGSLFVILLANMFFFSSYQSKVGALEETTMVLEISKANVLGLNQKVKQSQKRVGDILKSNMSKSSFYLDEIITSLSETILLDNYNYQPLLKRIRKDKPVLIAENELVITGTVGKGSDFSDWVTKLEDLDWIGTVDIQNFGDITNKISEFTLKIMIKDETAH